MSVLLADFEDFRLLEYIKTSNILTSFTDLYGNIQGPTNSASGSIKTQDIPPNERLVQVRKAGNDQQTQGNIGFSLYPMVVNVFSSKMTSDEAITEGLALTLRDWLIQNYQDDTECIISIECQGCNGPYYAEESRVYFEIPLLVRFNR